LVWPQAAADEPLRQQRTVRVHFERDVVGQTAPEDIGPYTHRDRREPHGRLTILARSITHIKHLWERRDATTRLPATPRLAKGGTRSAKVGCVFRALVPAGAGPLVKIIGVTKPGQLAS